MRIAPLAVVALALPATALADPGADEVVAKVQGYYKKVDHLKGTFRQEVSNATFATTKKSHGTVELARPNKVRLDYANTTGTGVKRSLRSDGKHLWDVEHDNLEILGKELGRDPVPVAVGVLLGTAELGKDFSPSLSTSSGFGDAGSTVLQLESRTHSAPWKQLYLVVDPGDGHIRETVVIDSGGNVNHFFLDKLDPKAAVKDSDFIVDVESKELRKYKVVDIAAQKPRTDK